jgi:PiT family inorganic phosphate transporter
MGARADTSACATTIEPEALTGDCAIAHWGGVIATTLDGRASVSEVPKQARWQIREAVLRIDGAWAALGEDGRAVPEDELAKLDVLTDYAPPWVILAIALALGIGTTVGYKRIVVTVGEKIGKSHLTYAQGACAELVAVITIGMSSLMGLPVSTTHVLSSGVAGTMVAQRSGLQTKTVTNIALAWVLTLPAAMLLSALLYTLLVQLV